jgi:hypothetical protein
VIWRAFIILDALTLAAYAADVWDERAAWATLAGLSAVLLPLSEIARLLSDLLKELRK